MREREKGRGKVWVIGEGVVTERVRVEREAGGRSKFSNSSI